VKDGAVLSIQDTSAISQILFPEELNAVRVSVLGLFDRGKTHLLNKLSKSVLPNGRRVRTKGISVKRSNESEHIGRKVLFLDTAGMKEPLLKKEILEHVEILKQMKPFDSQVYVDEEESVGKQEGQPEEELEDDTSDQEFFEEDIQAGDVTLTEAEEREREKKVEAWKLEIEATAKDRAIINKQVTEQFLQELIFFLSDVLIVVVNELTWDDQLYLEALARKLKEYKAKQDSNRFGHIIVVHNYRDSTDKDQLEHLVSKFVVDCFEGDMENQKIFVPGSSARQEMTCFRNKDGQMLHVWLAQDDEDKRPSPAGDTQNPKAYEFLLKQVEMVNSTTNKKPLLVDVCQKGKDLLNHGFFSAVDRLYFCKHNGKLVLKGISQVRKTRSGKQIRPPLKLLPDKLINTGNSLVFANRSDFAPKVDVLPYKVALIIVIDLPGFTTGVQKPDKLQTGCQLKLVMDTSKDELVVTGERKLYIRLISEGETVPGSKCEKYMKDSYGVTRCEREYGKFEVRVPIPHQYDRQSIPKFHMENGLLQITVDAIMAPTFAGVNI